MDSHKGPQIYSLQFQNAPGLTQYHRLQRAQTRSYVQHNILITDATE